MPRFIAKGTFVSGSGAVSPGIPAGLQAGDLMLLFVHSANQAASAPSGWTAIPSVSGSPFRGTAGAAGGVRLDVFYRWWQSGDSAPSVADTGDITCAIICAYGSVDPTTPFDNATPIGSNAAASTTLTLPGITTQSARALVVQAAALDRDAASTTTVSGAPTNSNLAAPAERHDQTVSTNTGGGLAVFDGIKQAAGATGDTTATQTSNAFACITLSLRHDSDDPFLNAAGAAGGSANKPDGVMEGDLMVAFLTVSGTGATLTGPAGWTQVLADDDGGVSAILAYKIAGASEGSSYSFTVSSGSMDSAAIAAYMDGGFDDTDPIDTSSYNSGNSGTRTASGITTANDNAILGFWSAGANAPTSIPAGMYRRLLYDAGLYAYHDEKLGAAGATGDRSHTHGSGPWGVILYAINPPPAPPAGAPSFQAFAFG